MFSQNFALMFTNLLVHIWVRKIKTIFIVPQELNKNLSVHLNFCHFGIFWWTAREEGKCKKKLQVIVNLPYLGYYTGKNNKLMLIYWCLQRSSQTKRWKFSRKTYILDFELWVRRCNYINAATLPKHGPVHFFQKLLITPEN